MTDLSSRLTTVRKKCSPSPSQAEVAKALNIAQSTYARFESGTREPPLSFIVNFCRHFNVTADYILGLSDSEHSQAKADSTSGLLNMRFPRDLLDGLNNDQSTMILATIEAFRTANAAKSKEA